MDRILDEYYRCRICDLKITHDNLLDEEWCCGRCEGFDDWDEIRLVEMVKGEEGEIPIPEFNLEWNSKIL